MRKWFSQRQQCEPVRVPYTLPTVDAADVECVPQGYRHRATDDDGNLIWPEDPDETPAWWFERQALALTIGLPNPPYRTKREMESAINAIELAERGFEPMEMSGPFTPDEAASRFLTYLQSHNVRQEYAAAELTDVYTEYCATQNIVASPIDFVKASLALMPAVDKKKIERKGPDGKRTRPVCWIIEPRLAPTTSTAKTKIKPVTIEPITIENAEPIRMAA